eukprot:scaffold13971_cov69-Phaeocystis_antarctica.AAC.9
MWQWRSESIRPSSFIKSSFAPSLFSSRSLRTCLTATTSPFHSALYTTPKAPDPSWLPICSSPRWMTPDVIGLGCSKTLGSCPGSFCVVSTTLWPFSSATISDSRAAISASTEEGPGLATSLHIESTLATSSCLCIWASSKAVFPSLFLRFVSAPTLSMARTQETWPLQAACMMAVQPSCACMGSLR